MPNLKTSDFPGAGPLSGPEIVGIVQSGADVQTTVALIAKYAVGTPNNVAIGYGSQYGMSPLPSHSISIGGGTVSSGSHNSIAIGLGSTANGQNSIVIGHASYTSSNPNSNIVIGHNSYAGQDNITGHAIAIGDSVNAAGETNIAIGYRSVANGGQFGGITLGAYSTTIGNYSTSLGFVTYSRDNASTVVGAFASSYNSGVAVGAYAMAHGTLGIAVGVDASVCNSQYGIAIGYRAIVGLSDHSIAIGYRTSANSYSIKSVAVGNQAETNGRYDVSIGHHTATYGYSVAIGGNAKASNVSVAVGNNANTINAGYGTSYSVAIGQNAHAKFSHATAVGGQSVASKYGIAIGHNAQSQGGQYNIVIGSRARTDTDVNTAIAIGWYANASQYSVTIGARANTVFGKYAAIDAIAIGRQSSATSKASVVGFNSTGFYGASVLGSESFALPKASVVGYSADSGFYGVAIGANASSNTNGVAIGAYTSSNQGGVALGSGSSADANYSIAINAHANQPNSVVIGSSNSNTQNDSTIASFMVHGFPNSIGGFNFTPTTTQIKLVGPTFAPTVASISYFDMTFYTIATGISQNSVNFIIDARTDIARGLFVDVTPTSLTINLASDGGGLLLGDQNKFSDILTAMSGNPYFTATISPGHENDLADSGFSGNFSGATDAVDKILTVDNGAETSTNTLALFPGTIGILSGNVIGYQGNILSNDISPNDVAYFKINNPIIIIRDNVSHDYSFIGTPTFSLINSTDGASSWTAPTLTIHGTGDPSIIRLTTYSEDSGDIYWMAFLTLETNQ